MDTNNNNKVWWVVGIIVVVGIGAWMLMRPDPAAAPVEAPSQSSITMSDQDANMVGVTIDSVTFAVSGFIEIHADDAGKPSAYVGSSKVMAPGTYTNESIIMTTTPGSYYWAMLHSDDGNGIFEAAKDLPIKNAAGEPVMQKFQVKPTDLIKIDIKG